MTKQNQKVAIVTGASDGVGAAVAERLAKNGFMVVVNYDGNAASADAVVARIEAAGGQAVVAHADVADAYAVRRMFESVETAFGGVDVLINNAGILNLTTIAESFAVTPEIRVLQKLCIDGENDEFATPAVRSHLATALLIRCLAQIERTDALPPASFQTHGAMLVSEVKAFLVTHAAKDVSLDQLAEHFGISRRHITRLFRDHVGRSIGEFQQSERLVVARRMLTETDLPIGEIAFRVGFESASALARAMRRRNGLSPSMIRATVARSVKS